jgi:phosphatidylinositol-3-phosphatase
MALKHMVWGDNMKFYDAVVRKVQKRYFRAGRRKHLPGLVASAFMVPALLSSLAGFMPIAASTPAGPLALCGNPGPAPEAIQHVIVVMLENRSYNQVVGSANAPYQTSLAGQCGVGTSYFGATHTSAANYLAVSAGEYPSASPPGCGSVKACADSSNNLYNQLTTAGLSWNGFMEAMPTACDPTSSGEYKNGHDPIIFYTGIPAAECQADDLGVSDLAAQSGVFWNDLQNQTLPSFSWVTPSEANDGEGQGTSAQNEQTADTWLQNFIAAVQQSNSYQSGNTLVLVTYDEGSGSDAAVGEDCTNESRDLPVTNGTSAHQDSCHVPLFVVYPYAPAGDNDSAFFDHYSITKTIEDLFGLPYLAHAGDAQTNSLVGHFGIPPGVITSPSPVVSITQPASNSTVSGALTVAGTAGDAAGIAQVQVSVDNGAAQLATGTTSWTASIDTTALTNGTHTINVQATDTDGNVGTASVTVTVNNTTTATSCPATPAGTTELSGNLSLEASQAGWTGVYNASSHPTRVEPAGSYDGSWALEVAPKAGAAGAAGVNNANPIWVPGAPGIATTSGQVYTGSAFVAASTPGEKISLLVRETTPSGTAVSSHTTSVTLSNTNWQQITSAYTAKGTGDQIRYSLYAANFASSQQYFLADCLSLQTP